LTYAHHRLKRHSLSRNEYVHYDGLWCHRALRLIIFSCRACHGSHGRLSRITD
jgi:hypothetical protein